LAPDDDSKPDLVAGAKGRGVAFFDCCGSILEDDDKSPSAKLEILEGLGRFFSKRDEGSAMSLVPANVSPILSFVSLGID
jgi:hypothetical protein